MADLLGRSTHPVEAPSGKEWQLKISIVKAYIDRKMTGLPPSSSMHYGMYIMGCIGSFLGFFKKRWEFALIYE